jgi:hypothetical protein
LGRLQLRAMVVNFEPGGSDEYDDSERRCETLRKSSTINAKIITLIVTE